MDWWVLIYATFTGYSHTVTLYLKSPIGNYRIAGKRGQLACSRWYLNLITLPYLTWPNCRNAITAFYPIFKFIAFVYFTFGTTGVSWALLVYMQNCQPTLLVFLVRQSPPQTPPLSVNAFCIVTNSAHETPVCPYFLSACIVLGRTVQSWAKSHTL